MGPPLVGVGQGVGPLQKDLLLALVFHVFNTTSRLVSTPIALHAPLIIKKCPFLLEKILIGLSIFPTSQQHIIFQVKMDIFSILMVHENLLLLIQDMKL